MLSRSLLAALLICSSVGALQAAPPLASQASSAASAIPVVVAVTAPAVLASGVGTLTLVAIEASAEGTVWTLERASDGARVALTLSGEVVTASGTVVEMTAGSAGTLLSVGGEVLALIPNELGRALLHHERLD